MLLFIIAQGTNGCQYVHSDLSYFIRTFWRISRNAKKCRGWVQIQNYPNPKIVKKTEKSETGRCKFAPTCLALRLFQGL